MTLLAVERMKLFSTRSPWWCTAIALAITIGFGALMSGTSNAASPMNVAATQFGYTFGLVVVMVMAALAITTEYRFSTIRATFLAVPNRPTALLAKTAVVAILAGIVGELCAFGSWGISKLIKSSADLGIDTAYEWRAVAGVGLVYAIAAVIAVGVGVLVRHSAGAIALLLIYTNLVEGLVTLIPTIGPKIHRWLPFNMSNAFITGDADITTRPINEGPPPAEAGLGPWPALLYFAAFAVVVLVIAITTAKRRDA
ncbi:ABC transporter permease [Actinokineospora enzanensis]|uniref:ABC transporter permease n=1 Tax=Actinokineospora enzanensis TaxID=155975 RepID=UPI00036ACA56|nr:ABC transporter permease [Actinokineospora enzanensis]